jgi:hypothetical protein
MEAESDAWTDAIRTARMSALRCLRQISQETAMSTPFQISLAPDQLWQAINPMTFTQQGGQFGLINIDLGGAGDSDLERRILKTVGSYGRQLGRIGDALEVILKHVKLEDLTSDEQDAVDILKGQLAAVRQVKARDAGSGEAASGSQSQPR